MRTGAHVTVQVFNAVDHRGVTQAAKQGYKLLTVTAPRHRAIIGKGGKNIRS